MEECDELDGQSSAGSSSDSLPPMDTSFGSETVSIVLEADDSDEEDRADKTEGKKGPVWKWRYPNKYPYKYFTRLDKVEFVCDLCKNDRKLQFHGPTSLTQHMKAAHKSL